MPNGQAATPGAAGSGSNGAEQARQGDAGKTGAPAAEKPQTEIAGHSAFDSDVHKALEGACYSLGQVADPALGQHVESMLDRIVAAHQDDGYLVSYFIAKEPGKRWADLRCGHEGRRPRGARRLPVCRHGRCCPLQRRAKLTLEPNYPWDGKVKLTVTPEVPATIALRPCIPGWAHENLLENRGRVALMRGPLVYCFEGIDNAGVDLFTVALEQGGELTTAHHADLLGGVTVIQTTGVDGDRQPVKLASIPYFAWANRGKAPMNLWLHAARP